nr:MAG TPA: hypothetical protein [Caudoviricetes sp.]
MSGGTKCMSARSKKGPKSKVLNAAQAKSQAVKTR